MGQNTAQQKQIGKILLYYKFVPISDPVTVMHWQRALCQGFGLKGRILISTHGINGTLGGSLYACKQYVRAMKSHPMFEGIMFKWSDGEAADFPRLSVKVRDEVVSFKASEELKVGAKGIENGGIHLKPEDVNKLVAERGDDVIFYDGRNAFEAKIGRFKNAIVPNVESTKDFLVDLESGEISKYKDKPIVTYCTGGIRCEILSTLMLNRGYSEVYQIDGGIVKYGETYPDQDSLWEGKLYVFDKRMSVQFSESAVDLGDCIRCDAKTSKYIDCGNMACNKLVVLCDSCKSNGKTFCSNNCEGVSKALVK
jgi:UPF0176 protein